MAEPNSMEAFADALSERYILEHELGRGGMSIVYLARDLKIGREVALKLLRPEIALGVGGERFEQEIQIASHLQHPNILALHDYGVAAGRLYYVMPLVDGESLRQRLDRERQLPSDEAVMITQEVAAALHYAHKHGVVHRDIKPENILLSSGHPLIADFGVARALAGDDGTTSSGYAVGTPLYMSPEQASGDEILDGRSDVYSLGCVLYEMLAGEAPFTGPSGQAILARKLEHRPRSLRVVRPTIAPYIERAIKRSLAPVAADRFATAADFAEALTPRNDWPRRSLGAALVILAAGLLLVVWHDMGRKRLPAPGTPDPNRIAVLYFTDRTATSSIRHVASGLTEDLIDALSRVPVLRVVPPSGVRPYREHAVPLDSLVRALDVGTLVEGSVARTGTSLRVSVRMVDPVNGDQIAEHTLERPWGDLFALEEDLAEEVSQFLRQRLGREILLRERKARTRSVTAWELVRRADELQEEADTLLSRGDRENAAVRARRADSLLAVATRADRRWTEPIVTRGWLSLLLAATSDNDDPRDEAREGDRGITFADEALAIASNDARALELRGYLEFQQWRGRETDPKATLLLQSAEQDLRQAVALDPRRAQAWNFLSLLYQQRGDFAEAAVALNKALEADAYLQEAAQSIQLLFFAALERGDSSAAASWCETGQARFPQHPAVIQCRLLLLGWTGRGSESVQSAWHLLRSIESSQSANALAAAWAARRWMVAAVLARTGMAESAYAVLRNVRSTVPDSSMLQDVNLYEAYIFTLLGEHNRALASLDSFVQTHAPESLGYVARTRWFLSLHEDPQFRQLLGEARVRRPPP